MMRFADEGIGTSDGARERVANVGVVHKTALPQTCHAVCDKARDACYMARFAREHKHHITEKVNLY